MWSGLHHMASEQYAVMHSGHAHPFSGVMVIVRLSIIAARPRDRAGVIRWHEPVPGRLLHAQFPVADGQYFDVMSCYNKHVSSGSDAASQELREQVWQSLYQTMQACARRNLLLIGMDVNSPITPMSPWIGASCPTVRQKASHDQRRAT